MANKLIVIPEEVYRNLLHKKDILADPLDNALVESNENLTKILHDPLTTNDEKYIQYDQKLKKMQSIISDKNEKQLDTSSINTIFPQILKALEDLKPIQNTPQSTPTPPPPPPPPPPPTTPQTGDPFKTPLQETKTFKRTPNSSETPRAVPKSRAEKYIENTEKQNTQYDRVMNYISENKDKFGISDSGKIKTPKGKVVPKSNLTTAVRFMLGMSGHKKPPGFDHLHDQIKDDEDYKKIIFQKGSGIFKPKLWNHC